MSFWENISLKGKLFFSGILGQFNQALCLILFVYLGMSYLLLRSVDQSSRLSLIWIILLGFLCIIGAAIAYHWKRRYIGNIAPALEFKNGEKTLKLTNVPDQVFNKDYMTMIMRGLVVGFDKELESDGRVIGKAIEGQWEKYTETEKAQWKTEHINTIAGKKQEIEMELAALETEADAGEKSEQPESTTK